MDLSSVLVNARPETLRETQVGLSALGGVEVHAATADGRLIVTIEADSAQAAADTCSQISQQPGVLSVAMVYHYFEPDPDKEVTDETAFDAS